MAHPLHGILQEIQPGVIRIMENSIYIGLSKLMVLEENMNIVANNVANMNTAGYRGQNMLFNEYVTKPSGLDTPISMVLDYGQYQVTDPGPIRQTGNPLDVSIVGPGWFGVQTPGGTQYTRGGNFTLTPDGTLTTALGQPVAGDGGGPISIPKDAKTIIVSEDGSISTDKGQVGKLMLVEFPSEQKLDPVGNGLYKSDQAGTPSEKSTVKQGSLEGSNVLAVVEMNRMVKVLREYQSMQRLLQTEHERMRGAIRQLASVNG